MSYSLALPYASGADTPQSWIDGQTSNDSFNKFPNTDEGNQYSCITNSFTVNELEIIEAALLRILQDENPMPECGVSQRKAALSIRLNNNKSGRTSVVLDNDDRDLAPPSLDGTDLTLLTKLLNQLRILKAHVGEKGPMLLASDAENYMELPKNCVSDGSKRTVAEAATAATEAAKAAAVAAKYFESLKVGMVNLDATETGNGVCDVTRNSELPRAKDTKDGDVDIQEKKIVKAIERQNKITHWILGFMVITTAVWRFKAISFLLTVQRTLCNPFQFIGDFLSEGLKKGSTNAPTFRNAPIALPSLLHGEQEKKGSTNATTFRNAPIALPSLLHGEQHETVQDFFEQTFSDKGEENEGFTLSFDNILTLGKSTRH